VWLVMEYMAGGDLRHFLDQQKNWSWGPRHPHPLPFSPSPTHVWRCLDDLLESEQEGRETSMEDGFRGVAVILFLVKDL
jgi:hypothetical protein